MGNSPTKPEKLGKSNFNRGGQFGDTVRHTVCLFYFLMYSIKSISHYILNLLLCNYNDIYIFFFNLEI